MKKNIALSLFFTALSCQALATTEIRSPVTIIKAAPANHWRNINNDNTLYLELSSGRVVIELNPLLAPNHVKQLTTLAREGFYDGLNFYRFVEGFVAQAGDVSETKAITKAKKTVISERFHRANEPMKMTKIPGRDGYAATTGFINGFAVATNIDNNQYWQTHCSGAFAMARSNDPDSGGTEFYVVIGQAPRYLDRNLTVFGQVRSGIEHLQSLKRNPTTEPKDNVFDNQIISIKVASDVESSQRSNISVMKTNTTSFKELIQSRMNRPEAFFIERPNYVDVCGVTVPTKT